MNTARDVRLPAMRMTDVIMTEAGTDVLVYDQNSAALHTLNDMTAKVWRTLDGTKTAAMVSAETGLSEEIVLSAVSRLSDVSLLEGDLAPAARSGNSRRAMLKKAGIAASIPVIISVTAPHASANHSPNHCTAPTSCAKNKDDCCGLFGSILELTAGICEPVTGTSGFICVEL